MDNVVEVKNIVVENLIIKLGEEKELKLKVSLNDWLQPIIENIFKIDSYYRNCIENTLNSYVDYKYVKYLDKIDYEKLENKISEKEWNKEDFDFNLTKKYDYIINNLLCVSCNTDYNNDSYYIRMDIPTNSYDYIEGMISFELKGFNKTWTILEFYLLQK